MQLADFHYDLPAEYIARYPLRQRSASRLLCLERAFKTVSHREFTAITELLSPKDLLIFNDTKVMPARLFGSKKTGGRVEILVERILDPQRLIAQVRASKSPRIGEDIFLENFRFKILAKNNQFYELQSQDTEKTVREIIENFGQIPLPPYFQRSPEKEDLQRYQTVYAAHQGSVAAPTAGLHFDHELLQSLRDKKIEMAYLTLHIGAGTFLPVRTQDIREHKMHAEYFEISEQVCQQVQATKIRGGRVVAVGTTSLRALETASQSGSIKPYSGDTSIFIYPGYQFNCVDALITNLHLPASTLLMLVCAFGGYENVMHAYQQAIQNQYRFYSYGDAMWMER